MKTLRRGILACLVLGLAAAKLLLPDVMEDLRKKSMELLFLDTDYKAVFLRLGERLNPSAEARVEPEISTDLPAHSLRAGHTAPRPGYISYRIEEAPGLGEAEPERPEPEPAEAQTEPESPAVPAAVTAFLESQSAFRDYALPDTVDYSYEPLPFSYSLPVAGYRSSGFGYRVHPILNTVRFHYGTDVAAYSGEEIAAFADGTVSFAGYSDSFGNYVLLEHAEGWSTLYAHCSALFVSGGQQVHAGERIALVGETGLATGPHLHFELKRNGTYYNPEYYVNG